MSTGDPGVQAILVTVGIPELNRSTAQHVYWRWHMLHAHWRILREQHEPAILEVVTLAYLNRHLGTRATVDYVTPAEFYQQRLKPPYSKLTAGQAGGFPAGGHSVVTNGLDD